MANHSTKSIINKDQFKILVEKINFTQTWTEPVNLENRFTGWTDVDLTKKGRIEAREAGRLLKENQFKFDLVLTSYLRRSIDTTKYA